MKLSFGLILSTANYEDAVLDWRKIKDPKYLKKQVMHEGRMLLHDKGEGSGFNLQNYYNHHTHFVGFDKRRAI